MGELEDLIEKTVAIPSIPQVYVRVEEIMSRPDSSMAEMVMVLEADPGVAVRCLRVANSALYCRRQPCTSLKQAVALLGMRVLRDIALQASLVTAYQGLGRYERFDLGRFWAHSAVTGHTARQLTALRGFKTIPSDVAAVCGLVHNIGRLTMLDAFRNPYLDVIVPVSGYGAAALRAEQEAFGFDHAVVGGVLAEKWKLSPDFVIATRDHHRPRAGRPLLATLVAIASEVAHATIELGDVGARNRLAAPDLQPFGMMPERVEELVETIADNAASALAAPLGA